MEIETFALIMKIFLVREKIPFKEKKSDSGSIYLKLQGRFPYEIRISDHKIPPGKKTQDYSDFVIMDEKQMGTVQQFLLRKKKEIRAKDAI